MILRKTTVVVDKELDIVSADLSYKDYVSEEGASSFFANVHNDDQHLLYEMVEALSIEEKVALCFRMCGKQGEYSWVSAVCTGAEDGNISMEVQDLTSAIENGTKVSELDYLTGLYNKKSITDYAKGVCTNNKDRKVNLCIVDIDNFKSINDTKGHAYGDKVLKEVSSIILEVLGKDGRAGRIGGDELMLVIEDVEEKTDLRVYLKGIRERVEASYRDESGMPQVTVSMGVGTFPLYVDNYDDLFNLADRMLYRAKNRGKNRYVIYNPDIHGKIVNGELNESTVEVSNTTAVDKTKLVLESIEGLFLTNNEAIATLLKKITATFELDQTYIFYKDVKKSYNGFKRISDSGNATDKKVYKTIDVVSEIEYALEPEFEVHFNSNGVFVIDTPQNQLSGTKAALQFFDVQGIKHAFIYKMQNVPSRGYIALYNTRDLSRKFASQDITDLTYLAKMIEVALKRR